ncbi:MAG: 3'-5' exonuclease domain-containing protein 2, partial [Comamonas sp.]
NDKSTLPKRLGVELANVLDLDRVFKQYGYGASIGVRAAIALVLGQSFHKSKKQSTSNWSLPHLSEAQIRYAANDAHAPAMVFAALPAWQTAQPEPPTAQRSNTHKVHQAEPAPRSQSSAANTTPSPRPRQAALFRPRIKPTDQ